MKNTHSKIILIFAIAFCQLLVAQDFQGQATYFAKTVYKDAFVSSEKENSEDAALTVKFSELMKKAGEKSYDLDFNATESTYLKSETLEAPKPESGGFTTVSISFSGENTTLYKNIKTKTYLQELENFKGKTNLVSDNLPTYDWKISGETKKIGNYDCYKATAVLKVKPEQLANFEKEKERFAKSKSKIFEPKAPTDTEIIAWFTNAIPVGHGPAKYWGLPGLILELTADRTTYLCTKVVINPKNKKPIKMPSKGKPISQKDFDAAEKKYFDSMADENGVIMYETKEIRN